MGSYSIGIDFGTQEARAMLVDMNGTCVKDVAFRYPHGVMSEQLPDGTLLRPGFALQHPQDYIDAIHTMLNCLLQEFPEKMKQVIGIGVDFTQCTMMPVDRTGQPLCFREEYKSEPYAYAKLWKHHGAQKQAEHMTKVAKDRKEAFLEYYGNQIYAEGMFPKILETYESQNEVYKEADQFIELADWIPFYLTGSQKRSQSIAGCAALWNPQNGYPDQEYFEAVASGFGKVTEKLTLDLVPVGTPVGYLKETFVKEFGFSSSIPVAAGLGDCQAAFVGCGLAEEHILLSVMGTSSCDMLIDKKGVGIPGLYGVSSGSMIPDFYGYEAGQATMGDLFAWFSKNWIPEKYKNEAEKQKVSVLDYLNGLAEQYEPGQTGLLALDWWNGNRSVLLDTDLSGLILGLDMNTRCEEVYRTLIEALAFGKRRIVEQFQKYRIEVDKLYATGGVANKNPFLMQLFSDVIGIPVYISAAENGSCLGSAIYGATVAGTEAGGYDSLEEAAAKMGGEVNKIYRPREEYREAYNKLYEEYKILHDYFGIQNTVMKSLKNSKRGNVD